jgi:hypothetical protein
MKKWILFSFFLVILVGFGIGLLYGKKILVAAVQSTLASKYQIEMEYDNVGLALLAGGVSFDELKVSYTKPDPPLLLASVGELDVGINFWKAIKGSPELSKVNTDRLAIEIAHNADGSLPWANAVKKFQEGSVPDPRSALADASSASRQDIKLPAITMKNSTFVYVPHDKNAGKQHVDLGYMRVNFQSDRIEVSDAFIYEADQKQDPLLKIDEIKIDSALNSKSVAIAGDSIVVTVLETGKDRYNVNDTINAWMGAINQLVPPSSSAPKSKTEPMALKSGEIKNVQVKILSRGGQSSSKGSILINLGSASVKNDGDEIVLNKIEITEAGQDAVKIDSLTFSGAKDGFLTLDTVDLSNAEITVREDADLSLNLARAITRIQSLVNSLLPKSKSSASSKTAAAFSLPTVTVNGAKFVWHKPDNDGHGVSLKTFTYAGNTKTGELKDFLISSGIENPNTLLQMPTLTLSNFNFDKNEADQLLVDQLKIHGILTKDGMNLSAVLDDWSSFLSRVYPTEEAIETAPADAKPFKFGKISFTGTRIELRDTRLAQVLNLVIDPLDLHWSNAQIGGKSTSLGDFSLVAKTVLPTESSLSFNGKAASFWNPINLDLVSNISIKEITTLTSHFAEKMPIGLLNSGMNLDGAIKVNNNFLDSNFNVLLKNPKFSSEQGKWLAKIDAKSAVTALNGMRDSEGDILFKNNKLAGNIFDPKFDFGTSVTQIIAQNMVNRIGSVLNLPLDVAGKGANILGDGANTVQKGVGGLLNGLLGGKKKE